MESIRPAEASNRMSAFLSFHSVTNCSGEIICHPFPSPCPRRGRLRERVGTPWVRVRSTPTSSTPLTTEDPYPPLPLSKSYHHVCTAVAPCSHRSRTVFAKVTPATRYRDANQPT